MHLRVAVVAVEGPEGPYGIAKPYAQSNMPKIVRAWLTVTLVHWFLVFSPGRLVHRPLLQAPRLPHMVPPAPGVPGGGAAAGGGGPGGGAGRWGANGVRSRIRRTRASVFRYCVQSPCKALGPSTRTLACTQPSTGVTYGTRTHPRGCRPSGPLPRCQSSNNARNLD